MLCAQHRQSVKLIPEYANYLFLKLLFGSFDLILEKLINFAKAH